MLGFAREKIYNNYSSSSTPTAPYSMYDLVNGGNTNGSGVSFPTTNTASPSYPSTSTPYEMSDWYGYDNDASSYTSFSGTSKQNTANAACTPLRSTTYYHDGSGANPTTGDEVYSNAAGTVTLDAGYYGICGGGDGTSPFVLNVGANGIVSQVPVSYTI